MALPGKLDDALGPAHQRHQKNYIEQRRMIGHNHPPASAVQLFGADDFQIQHLQRRSRTM